METRNRATVVTDASAGLDESKREPRRRSATDDLPAEAHSGIIRLSYIRHCGIVANTSIAVRLHSKSGSGLQ